MILDQDLTDTVRRAGWAISRGSRYSRDDVIQEGLIAVAMTPDWRSKGYAITSARNRMRQVSSGRARPLSSVEYESRRYEPRADNWDDAFPAEDMQPPAHDDIADVDLRESVGSAMNTLRPSHRMLVEEMLSSGSTVTEAARALGIDPKLAGKWVRQYIRPSFESMTKGETA